MGINELVRETDGIYQSALEVSFNCSQEMNIIIYKPDSIFYYDIRAIINTIKSEHINNPERVYSLIKLVYQRLKSALVIVEKIENVNHLFEWKEDRKKEDIPQFEINFQIFTEFVSELTYQFFALFPELGEIYHPFEDSKKVYSNSNTRESHKENGNKLTEEQKRVITELLKEHIESHIYRHLKDEKKYIDITEKEFINFLNTEQGYNLNPNKRFTPLSNLSIPIKLKSDFVLLKGEF
jgi:hypothetical protein